MRPTEHFVAAGGFFAAGKYCVNLGITTFLTDRTIGPAAWARHVEERGFHSLYLPEHTHLPVEADVPPSLVEGVSTDDYRRGLDPYAALAAAASVTTTLRLGTGVSLVAQHDPIVLAKQIATIDHISGGRFVLGIGFGWNRVEAADHGVAFDERRAVAREKVLCMKALWSEDKAEFHGRYVQLPPSWAWPKPVQKPWVPTLIGGGPGRATFEAIAEYADGWMPVGGSGIALRLSELRREFVARERDPAQLQVVPFGTIPSPGKLDHLAAAGATEVVLRVPAGDTSDMLRCLDEYRTYLEQAR
jgi:probable F420-dependent oxidoreductase